MTENEIKAIKELQDEYEYLWNKSRYEECETLVKVFCILNKHLTGHTGWRIEFEGSKADELINAIEDRMEAEERDREEMNRIRQRAYKESQFGLNGRPIRR